MDDVSRRRGRREGRRLAAFIDGLPSVEEMNAVAAPGDEEDAPPPPLAPELEARLLRDIERAHPAARVRALLDGPDPWPEQLPEAEAEPIGEEQRERVLRVFDAPSTPR